MLRHVLISFPSFVFLLLSSVFSQLQGGLRRRVCLAPGLSCYRGLNAMETKFLLHNSACMCACTYMCTMVKYGHIPVELGWLLLCLELPQIAPPFESNLDWMQTWLLWFGWTVIRKQTVYSSLQCVQFFIMFSDSGQCLI